MWPAPPPKPAPVGVVVTRDGSLTPSSSGPVVTPESVVSRVLYAPATALVPVAPLPTSEVALVSAWSPEAVVSTVPQAALQALTLQGIAAQLTPTALTQNAAQTLAMAAVLAVLA